MTPRRPPGQPDAPAVRPPCAVTFMSHLFLDHAGKHPAVVPASGGGTKKEFTGVGQSPWPWRRLGVKVTPTEVTVLWEENGKLEPFRTLPTPRLEGWLRDRARHFEGNQMGGVPTGFSPQAGLGFYVAGGKAAFRRVVIEPFQEAD